MHEATRFATEHDLGRLETLLEQAYGAAPTLRGGDLFGHPFRTQPMTQRLLSALSSEHHQVLVATLDEHVVGFSITHIDDRQMGFIEELYIEPAARELGLGELLLTNIVDWCTKKRCTGIDLTALPGDRATKNLCERSGFVARLLIMHRALPAGD